MLYLASDVPLREVGEGGRGDTSFHARPADSSELKASRRAFTRVHVSYLGSCSGCGCGFRFGAEDGGDHTDTLQSLAELAAYIATAADQSDLELLVTWGSRLTGPMERRSVTVDHFAAYEQGIDLPENCLFEIERVGHGQRPDEVSKA